MLFVWYRSRFDLFSGHSSAADTHASQTMLRWSHVEIIVAKNMWSSETGWMSSNSFVLLLTLTRFFNMSITSESGYAYPSPASVYIRGFFSGSMLPIYIVWCVVFGLVCHLSALCEPCCERLWTVHSNFSNFFNYSLFMVLLPSVSCVSEVSISDCAFDVM